MKTFFSLFIIILLCGPIYSDQLYTVQTGDTLSEICARVIGNSKYTKQIAELNKIEDPDLIYVGQIINMSISSNNTKNIRPVKQVKKIVHTIKNERSEKIHIVKKNETLSHIALQHYGTAHPENIQKIIKLNDLKNDIIYPGMMLNIVKSEKHAAKVSKMYKDTVHDKRLQQLIIILETKLRQIRERRIQHDRIVKIMKDQSFDTSYVSY